jgi:hypothetical protein
MYIYFVVKKYSKSENYFLASFSKLISYLAQNFCLFRTSRTRELNKSVGFGFGRCIEGGNRLDEMADTATARCIYIMLSRSGINKAMKEEF